jgi:bacillithiol biosynthesis cysteine-adding enzyme BshC
MPELTIFATMNPDTSAKTSFKVVQIPYRATGYFSGLVLDYLDEAADLKPFYHRFPRLAHFAEQAKEKSAQYPHREALVEALEAQYASAKLKSASIAQLASANTFCITTGHQVCLFTGPVYFIYKIVSAIKTCRLLSAAHPQLQFVPVFWMATEDHDFAEANHFELRSGKISWEGSQQGAVGRMTTEGLQVVAEQLREALGLGYHAADLLKRFEQAYLGHDTIAAATRYLVHQLFGAYGVVCVDGDDAMLKRLAAPVFRRELFDQLSYTAVTESSEALSAHYSVQAHPREINLFYLGDGKRERIVRAEDGSFEVVNSHLRFSAKEMEAMVGSHPERLSPNVVLRPLYQELVLPNLAYIGGGGELAYWFQLKAMFETYAVPFPILMLRNSGLMLSGKDARRLEALGLHIEALFEDPVALETALVKRETAEDLQLKEARESLALLYGDLEERLGRVAPTLARSARSAFKRSEHLLSSLEKKLLRAERKKQSILLQRLHGLRGGLFPGGSLQERKLNFAEFYMAYGPAFIDSLLDHFDPFLSALTVLQEVENP